MSKKKKDVARIKKGRNFAGKKGPIMKQNIAGPIDQSPEIKHQTEDPNGKKPAKKTPLIPGGFNETVNYPLDMASLPMPSAITSDSYVEYSEIIKKADAGELVNFNGFLPRRLPKELNRRLTGKGLVAAVIDTGVYRHNDLAPVIMDRFDCTNEMTRVSDIHGHGTHIAGIIGGFNGIAKEAGIISLKVTTKTSSETSWKNIVIALQKVLEYNSDVETGKLKTAKITVVNLSFNGFDNSDDDRFMHDHQIYQRIKELHDEDVPVVVSGGNYFDYMVSNQEMIKKYGLGYPANCRLTISAGASFNKATEFFGFEFKKGTIAPFTQRIDNGKRRSYDFFIAPAVRSVSAGIYGPKSYTEMTGSSQAAPVITGIILLFQQQFKEAYTRMPTVKDVKNFLWKASKPKPNKLSLPTGRVTTPLFPIYYDQKTYQHF